MCARIMLREKKSLQNVLGYYMCCKMEGENVTKQPSTCIINKVSNQYKGKYRTWKKQTPPFPYDQNYNLSSKTALLQNIHNQ